jgi:ElaB/YqjD/DUF883 family membrane-anchored ribosome-binding protein
LNYLSFHSLKKEGSQQSSLEKTKRPILGVTSTKCNRKFNQSLLKAQKHILKSFKAPVSTSEKSRNIQIVMKSSTCEESKIKLLGDSLVRMADSYPSLYSTLMLISEEYTELFRQQKEKFRGEIDREMTESEKRLKKSQERVKGKYYIAPITNYFNKSYHSNLELNEELKKAKDGIENMKKKYEREIQELKDRIKRKNDQVFEKMKSYIINELGTF